LHAKKLAGPAQGEQEALQFDFKGQGGAGWEGEEAGGAELYEEDEGGREGGGTKGKGMSQASSQ